MNKPVFIISLDFELAWGFHDIPKASEKYKQNLIGARDAIPKMLKMFEQYNVHATWAIVGALACKSKTELLEFLKNDIVYLGNNHSLHQYIKECVGQNEAQDPLHYAGPLIEQIKSSPNQYIGTHTFSHFFALDKTCNYNDFNNDLVLAKTIFPDVMSIVLPRNQISDNLYPILSENQIKCYRGTQKNANILSELYNSKSSGEETLLIRFLRLIDAYLPISGYYGYKSNADTEEAQIINLRASHFLRPYSQFLRMFEFQKINRILRSMKKAARQGEIYHLWWHPHNFGTNLNLNMQNLERILIYYQELSKKYGMESMSMEEMYEYSSPEPKR